MRLHRFYISTPIEDTRTVVKDERLVHQWRDVFRYNVGSEVILFDGSGTEYDAVIEKLSNREVEVRLVSERKGILPDKKIVLFQSLIKKDKMEWVVEKATELGVSGIVPVVSERSEKKGFNIERAQKIVIEASEQCGRADVPEIGELMKLEEALKDCEEEIIVFDPIETTPPFTSCSPPPVQVREHSGEGAVSIFIGPEGGWAEKELEIFKQKGAQVLSLGPLTLRAETAAIVALGVLELRN